jgi:outer membrane protein TolC
VSRYAWSGVVLLCAVLPLSVHAQVLEQLIASALASHPSAQGQRALVQSAEAGVDSARWQFYPTPSVSVETANASAASQRCVCSNPCGRADA